MNNTSPTPWSIKIIDYTWEIVDANNKTVVNTGYEGEVTVGWEDAQLIVLAVNKFQDE